MRAVDGVRSGVQVVKQWWGVVAFIDMEWGRYEHGRNTLTGKGKRGWRRITVQNWERR